MVSRGPLLTDYVIRRMRTANFIIKMACVDYFCHILIQSTYMHEVLNLVCTMHRSNSTKNNILVSKERGQGHATYFLNFVTPP